MGGREVMLKDNSGKPVSRQVLRPKTRKRVFAGAAVLTGALFVAGCGGKASSPIDSNLIVDNSGGESSGDQWKFPKPPESVPEPEKKLSSTEYFSKQMEKGGLDWVDVHFESAKTHRSKLQGDMVNILSFGSFDIHIIPSYRKGKIEILAAPHAEGTGSTSSSTIRVVDPRNLSYDGPRPSGAEGKKFFIVNEMESSQTIYPRRIPASQLIASGNIADSQLYLLDVGRVLHPGNKAGNLAVIYGGKGILYFIHVDHLQKDGPHVSISTHDFNQILSGAYSANAKNPLNTEYALAFLDSEDALHLFFAFSKKSPMDALSVLHANKSEKGKFSTIDFTTYRSQALSPDVGVRLRHACRKGNFEMVISLVGQGVDINASDRFGNTPLGRASCSGNEALVDLLLKRGANLHVESVGDGSPLLCACIFNHPSVVRLLLEHGADPNKFTGMFSPLGAAATKSPELVTLLLEHGAEIDLPDNRSMTPLMDAAERGRLDTIKLLVEAGAKLGLENKLGKTALDMAKEKGHDGVAEYLMSKGAKGSLLVR